MAPLEESVGEKTWFACCETSADIKVATSLQKEKRVTAASLFTFMPLATRLVLQ